MNLSSQQAKGTARCAGERAGGDDSAVAQLQFGAPGGGSKGGQPTLAPAGFLATLGSQSDPASLIPTLGGATAGQAAGGAAQQEQPGGGAPGKHILRSPILLNCHAEYTHQKALAEADGIALCPLLQVLFNNFAEHRALHMPGEKVAPGSGVASAAAPAFTFGQPPTAAAAPAFAFGGNAAASSVPAAQALAPAQAALGSSGAAAQASAAGLGTGASGGRAIAAAPLAAGGLFGSTAPQAGAPAHTISPATGFGFSGVAAPGPGGGAFAFGGVPAAAPALQPFAFGGQPGGFGGGGVAFGQPQQQAQV